MSATLTRRFSHTMIRASAGSGKTYQLTNRYLSLLYQGVSPEKILAVTFTRKAAGEIFDRIVLRLAQAASDDDHRRQLAEVFHADDLTAEKCRELLVGVTRTLHRLRVGTLDSFFAKVAGSCSMELNLPLGWRIVEELVDSRLRDRAIAESLAGESIQPVMTLLNLLAKGEALRSVSQLIRDAVDNLYFTARETPESVWKKLPRGTPLSEAELAEACQRLAALTYPHKGIMKEVQKDCEFVQEGDWLGLMSRGIACKILAGAEKYSGKPIGDEGAAIYATLIRQAKFELVGALASQTEATFDLLARFDEHYQRLKNQHAALRFDDVTFKLSRNVISDDDRVTFRLDATVDHLLLDEFQDTSLAQWNVLRPIAQRVTMSPDTSFFCVGDVKQAIYGWRGGLAELFDAVNDELPGLEEVPLDESFRSSPAVIEVVNRAFSNLNRHTNLEDYESAVVAWQERFRHHTTAKTNLQGFVTLETSDPLEEGDDDEAAERFYEFAAVRIAQEYQRSQGTTIGVLTRTNDAVLQLIYRLRGLGIPASEEGGNPLTDSCAVELILSLVRLADHPNDSAAAYHLARSPLAAELSLDIENYRRAALVSEKLRLELIDDGYGRTIYRWSQLLAASCDDRDRSRLQQLVELAYSYQPQSTLRPSDFLDFVEQQKVCDPTTSPVRVMTVHQAKGLEFDIVFLPELDANRTLLGQSPSLVSSRDGLGGDIDCVCRYTNEHIQKLLPPAFQEMFRTATDRQISEALCVLYVAMTRAIHGLHLLIRAPKANESNHPKTFAGLVRAALCDDASPSSGVLFEHGQRDWYEHEKKRRKIGVPRTIVPLPATPLKITLASPPAERRRGLHRESPSKLEGGSAARVRKALQLSDPKRDLAMLRGTVIHAWFEQITWLDDDVPDDNALLAAVATLRGSEMIDDNQRVTWLADFRAMLACGDVPTYLHRATYKKTLPKAWSQLLTSDMELMVRNEWPFAVIDGEQLLQGRIDRVVLLMRDGRPIAADVFDFKTDQIENKASALADRVEHYRPQVQAYCRTLVQQTGLPPSLVSGGLLFVGQGKFVRPK